MKKITKTVVREASLIINEYASIANDPSSSPVLRQLARKNRLVCDNVNDFINKIKDTYATTYQMGVVRKVNYFGREEFISFYDQNNNLINPKLDKFHIVKMWLKPYTKPINLDTVINTLIDCICMSTQYSHYDEYANIYPVLYFVEIFKTYNMAIIEYLTWVKNHLTLDTYRELNIREYEEAIKHLFLTDLPGVEDWGSAITYEDVLKLLVKIPHVRTRSSIYFPLSDLANDPNSMYYRAGKYYTAKFLSKNPKSTKTLQEYCNFSREELLEEVNRVSLLSLKPMAKGPKVPREYRTEKSEEFGNKPFKYEESYNECKGLEELYSFKPFNGGLVVNDLMPKAVGNKPFNEEEQKVLGQHLADPNIDYHRHSLEHSELTITAVPSVKMPKKDEYSVEELVVMPTVAPVNKTVLKEQTVISDFMHKNNFTKEDIGMYIRSREYSTAPEDFINFRKYYIIDTFVKDNFKSFEEFKRVWNNI